VASVAIDVGIQSDLSSCWRDLGNPTRAHVLHEWMARTLVSQTVVRKGKCGGSRGLCWVPCLFESETSCSRSWCGVLDRCERKGNECDVWSAVDLVLWMSCSGALHQRKNTRERTEIAAKRDDRGIGNPTHTAYDTVGATRREQLSVPFRGSGTRCAMRRPAQP
jgi:hypothetical protein